MQSYQAEGPRGDGGERGSTSRSGELVLKRLGQSPFELGAIREREAAAATSPRSWPSAGAALQPGRRVNFGVFAELRQHPTGNARVVDGRRDSSTPYG
jgi:hypothetical protein